MKFGRKTAWGRGAGVTLVGFALVVVAALAWKATAQTRVREAIARADSDTRERAANAKDGLDALVEGFAQAANNITGHPRFAAALAGRVDRATIADLLANEAWWAPHRNVLSVAVSYEGTSFVYKSGPVFDGQDLGPLVAAARANRGEVADLRLSGSRLSVFAVGTVPARQGPPIVVVLAKPVGADALDAVAERLHGPIWISAGQRWVASGGPPGATKAAYDVWTASQASQGSAPSAAPDWSLAYMDLRTPSLRVWTGTPRSDYVAGARAAIRRDHGAVAAVALALLAIGFVGVTKLTGPKMAPAARPDDALAAPRASLTLPALRDGLSLPATLGRYVLLDRLGEGGMAEIYAAVSFGEAGFRRNFVVKRLRPEMAQNPVAVAHFIDEANLAASLVHRNIVPVFDFGQAGRDYYMAQEYIVGRDLGRLVRKLCERQQPPLPPAAICAMACEVLTALEYAHSRTDEDHQPLHIVHRDISPENIILSDQGDVKLLDFGLVKALGVRVSHTDLGHIKGNVDFMSPEQAMGRPADHRSDLFSLGMVMYHAAACEALYRGASLYEQLLKSATGPGPEEWDRIATLPAPLPNLLKGALAVEPADRFQSAVAFREAVLPHATGGLGELNDRLRAMFRQELHDERDRMAASLRRLHTPPAGVSAMQLETGDRSNGQAVTVSS